MKINISTRQLYVLGLALLIITNLVVFAGVFYNRSGEPEQKITLTERELKTPYYSRSENSGIALQMIWRVLNDDSSDWHLHGGPYPITSSDNWREVAWLDRDKLETLGFDTEKLIQYGDNYQRRKVTIPREAYVVLEYDGSAHQQILKLAEKAVTNERKALASKPEDEKLQKRSKHAEKWLALERIEQSRLFVVDADLNLDSLKQKYGDSGNYIFAKGLISARHIGRREDPYVAGYIQQLHIDSIHVPLQFRQLFDDMQTYRSSRSDAPPNPPRYAVNLNYGKRIEPWIESVQKLEDANPEGQEVQPPTPPK